MSTNNNEGVLIGLIWVVTIAISIFSGILSWNWIKPHSFWGAVGFIIVWGILSKIGHFIAMGIVSLLSGDN